MTVKLTRKAIKSEVLYANWGVVTVGQRGDEKS